MTKSVSSRDIGSISPSPASLVRSQWWLIIHQWGLELKMTPNWVMPWHCGCFLSDSPLRSLFNAFIRTVVSLLHMFSCALLSFSQKLFRDVFYVTSLPLFVSFFNVEISTSLACIKKIHHRTAYSFSCRIWNSLPSVV